MRQCGSREDVIYVSYRIGLHQVTPLGVVFLFMLVNWWVEKHQRFLFNVYERFFFIFVTFLRFNVFIFFWNVFLHLWRTRAIPERFWGGDSLRRGAIYLLTSVRTFTLRVKTNSCATAVVCAAQCTVWLSSTWPTRSSTRPHRATSW